MTINFKKREKQDSENNVHKVNFTERKKLKEFTFQNKNPSRRGSDEEEIGVSKSKQTFQGNFCTLLYCFECLYLLGTKRGNANDELCKIQKKNFLDDILDDKGDFLNVDQMITPAHSSFENENDYQLVLSDIF